MNAKNHDALTKNKSKHNFIHTCVPRSPLSYAHIIHSQQTSYILPKKATKTSSKGHHKITVITTGGITESKSNHYTLSMAAGAMVVVVQSTTLDFQIMVCQII